MLGGNLRLRGKHWFGRKTKVAEWVWLSESLRAEVGSLNSKEEKKRDGDNLVSDNTCVAEIKKAKRKYLTKSHSDSNGNHQPNTLSFFGKTQVARPQLKRQDLIEIWDYSNF